jgi:hypothetical protein
MTDYVKSTNFASKDSLAIGNPLKIVKGTEIDAEFNNIATAVATKADIVSPTFTGTPAAPTATAGTNTTQLATTAFVGTAVSNAVTAYDAALTVSTSQIEDSAVTNAKLASGAAVANIGYQPVQQGTGVGQQTNSVKIGWSGTQLLATVDVTDMGAFAMQNGFTGGNQSLSGNGYQKLPGGLIMQWGTFSQTGASTTVSFPISFPNACLNVQQTCANNASVSAPGSGSLTTTGFDSIRDAAVGNSAIYYFAIGY